MSIGDYCERPAETVGAEETVRAAAQRMRAAEIGSLVVVAADGTPTGLVTDRSLALKTLSRRLDPGSVVIDEVASRPLRSVREDAPVSQAIRSIRQHAIRRLPVLSQQGELVGIASVDDLVGLAVSELESLRARFGGQGR